MPTVPQILQSAGVRCQDYPQAPRQGVFLTAANQLIGTYRALTRFRATHPEYTGWEAHHIVEARDLERLHIAHQFPVYEEQICVLIPKAAHGKRINSILNRQNPSGMMVNAHFLKQAYKGCVQHRRRLLRRRGKACPE
jgi:hypothetical protein